MLLIKPLLLSLLETHGNIESICFIQQRCEKVNSDDGVQGWRSAESTRLPPIWPGLGFQTRRHMWVEIVGSLLCPERFPLDTPVSRPLKNQHLI